MIALARKSLLCDWIKMPHLILDQSKEKANQLRCASLRLLSVESLSTNDGYGRGKFQRK